MRHSSAIVVQELLLRYCLVSRSSLSKYFICCPLPIIDTEGFTLRIRKDKSNSLTDGTFGDRIQVQTLTFTEIIVTLSRVLNTYGCCKGVLLSVVEERSC